MNKTIPEQAPKCCRKAMEEGNKNKALAVLCKECRNSWGNGNEGWFEEKL